MLSLISGVMTVAAQAGPNPVTVTVSNTESIPQQDVTVYAFSGTTYTGLNGVTDINGQVIFNLADGSYNFRADFNGTQFFSGGASGVDSCTIPDCTDAAVTVTSPVVVTVVDTNSIPQEGLNVYAYNGTTYSGKTGTTNISGTVSLTLLPGDYNFRADLNGTRFYSGGTIGVNTCTVPGCTADSVTVTAPVTVTVADLGGIPRAGVPVYAFNGTTYSGKTATTNISGTVSLTLLPGNYNFRADFNGTQFFSGGASGVDTCNIPDTGVDCTADSVTVTGGTVVAVQDTEGVPQEGLNVFAFNGTTYSGKTDVTNVAGEVTFTLIPGDYNFRADLNGTQFFSGGGSGVNTCTVPTCTVDIVTVTAPITVTVSDTGNVPQEGINVYAFNGTTYTGKSGLTDAAGQVTFTLLPGDYNFRADLNGYQFFSGGASGVDTCNIPAAGIQTCTADSVTASMFGLVDVTVSDTGLPVANQVVYLFDSTGTTYLSQSSTTDVNGVASFNLPFGDYLFATDLNGTRQWSSPVCSVPDCTAAAIAVNPTVLPASTCTLNGATRTCEFWAKEGPLTLVDGATVPIWGFSDSDTGPAQLPGPMIIANEGETIEVIFHNAMSAETVSMQFGGQALAPDLAGIAPGGTTTYSFTAVAPGTFRYEAGLTPNGSRQVAMGLYGALIIRPQTNPTGQAYNSATSDTSYDDEALLVFSEIDPDFNADPNNFDMIQFAPKYWLINGRSYTATDMVQTAPGHTVLLRYINAGLQEHTLGTMGLHQSIISNDGLPYQYAKTSVVRTLAAGETADALVAIPATAVVNSRYAIYNAGMPQLHNNGQGTSGGILTFLEVAGGAPVQAGGPLVTSVTVDPTVSAGTAPIALTVEISATNGANITAWGYFFNGVYTDTTVINLGTAVSTLVDTIQIPTATLATLPPGDVTIYVGALDDTNTMGPVNSTVLDLVTAGPTISGMTLTSSPANGTKAVSLRATADETLIGNVNVVAAEYFIGAAGATGSGTPMNLNRTAPISSLSAQIDAATIQGMTPGDYTIFIHALDELGNWGGFGTINLKVDKVGPSSTGVSLAPNPNNGTLTVNSSSSGVRMEIQMMDADGSIIKNAEGFIDYVDATTNPDGTGFPLIAKDALYDSSMENAYFIIPLATVRNLSEGDHIISFHGLDAAGNWGALGTMTLTVDKTGPAIGNIVADPNPVVKRGANTLPLTLTADAVDGVADIVAAEWFDGADPGNGQATPLLPADGTFNSLSEALTSTAINVRPWPVGDHIVSIRAKDAAGNWGEVTTTTVMVRRPGQLNAVFGDSFETANFSAWDTAVGAVDVAAAAATEGSLGMAASLDSGPAYLKARIPADANLSGYKISFDFSPNGAETADEEQQIFTAIDSSGSGIFGIMFEQGPDGPEVQAWALEADGAMTMTQGVHITNGVQKLELNWESGDSVKLVLSVDGIEQAALTGLDTSLYKLNEVQLGPSFGVADAASGVLYFDAFEIAPNQYQIYMPIVFMGGSN
jgi:FtsP/CotA-like multicopper oxidase with cupredoxin domain